MTVNRDKLGEFILVPESFNRYEVFAPPGSANWVSLSEATGAGTTHSAILFRQQLPAASTEKRVLIHSDRVYGKNRQASFYINLAQAADPAGDWLYEASGTLDSADDTQGNPGSPRWFQTSVRLRVRAITTDFDPAAVGWADAYGGSPALAFDANAVDQLVVKVDEGFACVPMHESSAYTIGSNGGDPGTVRSLENVMLRCDVAAWNALDAIYGFEVSLQMQATFGVYNTAGADMDHHAAWYRGTCGSALGFAIRK